jgi:hypothetical protein
MSEFDNIGIIINNTVITIIIIILIICFLPTISLLISIFTNKQENETLLKDFFDTEIKTDMEHNTRTNLYLLSRYIPYKRIVRCKKNKIGDEDKEDYDKYLMEANQIINRLDEIKRECEGSFYNTIKRESDKKIQENKSEREKREHDEYLIQIKEWGENERINKVLNQKWILYLFGGVNNIIKFFVKFCIIIIKIIGFFRPIYTSTVQSKVLMGFIILLFVIFMILYFTKLRNVDYNASISYGKTDSDKKPESNSWFSWIDGSSLWYEITDTYKYYDNMMNTFSISELTSGLIGTENKEGGKMGNAILDREITDGKIYDNLSYIMLSELNLNTAEIGKIKTYLPITDIETGKYYNIYLPEEKFKTDASIVKWKVYDKIDDKGKITNEKKWGINCEEIDKIKTKDGTTIHKITNKYGIVTDNPAFITVLNGANDKCVINESGFKKVNNENIIVDSDELIYDTEKIK